MYAKFSISRLIPLALILVLSIAQCPDDPDLGQSFLRTGECLESLKNSIYDFCPVVDIDYHYPFFCGISADKTWRNYTYVCEARNHGALAFYRRSCTCLSVGCNEGYQCINGNCFLVPTCDNINCGDGYKCVRGMCEKEDDVDPDPEPQPECSTDDDCGLHDYCVDGVCKRLDTCENVKCENYEDCEYGVCFNKYDYYCSRVQPQVLRYYCPIDRPTNSECPDTTFVPPLTPTVCGIGYDGTKRDFDRGCTACKHHHIYYYYDQACSTLPTDQIQCSENEECIEGECVDIDYCKGVKCDPGKACFSGVCLKLRNYCEKDTDCQSGYFCGDLNLCELRVVVDPCESVQCNSQQRCSNGKCIGICEGIYCPDKTECRQGLCHTIDPICTSNNDCKSGQICIDAKCRVPIYDSCYKVFCPPDKTCVFGVCVSKVDPCSKCAADEVCSNNQCIKKDPCANVKCSVFEKCMNGACVDLCTGVKCEANEECYNGICIIQTCSANCPTNSRCSTNKHCDKSSVCVGSYCMKYKKCIFDFQCYGSKCQDGFCKNDSY